jgi:uncharacterized repeat protein (TIGR03803 family)
MTPAGKLTTLISFSNSDGNPQALVQGTDGNFYGTTLSGGDLSCNEGYGCGTVFKVTASGKLTTLHSFDGTDGVVPDALIQATNGNFYGTAGSGGTAQCPPNGGGCGTVFSLSVGLGPFVETLPTSGNMGVAVTILGNNLTNTTSVTFNGTAATFTVNSTGAAIKTTVPSGATTGKVKVTTPHGTLTSNVNFRVL